MKFDSSHFRPQWEPNLIVKMGWGLLVTGEGWGGHAKPQLLIIGNQVLLMSPLLAGDRPQQGVPLKPSVSLLETCQ